LGGIPAFLLTPNNLRPEHSNRILLHIHGGGFVYYSGQAGTLEATMMAAYGGFKVISVDYRLAPDFPYPAALDDVIAAYRALITVHDPRRVGVFGSSSGGNLTLSLMLRAKAEALQLPAAMALGSPWSDISLSGGGDTIQTLEWIDGNLVSYNGYLHHAALAYANGLDMTVPYLSPLHGNFIGLPPAILTCGTRDLFLSLTAMTHRKLRQMNIIAELHVYEGLAHGQYLYPRLPESKEAFSEIGSFFDRHLS
jgi:acetyl esterase/lipase